MTTAASQEREHTLEEILQAVRRHAEENYESGGWDVVVECYDDCDLTHLLEDGNGNLPATPEKAIQRAAVYVGIWADRQADAINSAF